MFLARGDTVMSLENFSTGRRDNLHDQERLTQVEGSITDWKLVDQLFSDFKPDVVVHTAASYKDPEDAYRKLKAEYGERGATRDMRKREIEVATDDGTCDRQTHVPNTVLSLRRQYATSLPATDKRDLRQLADIWKAAAAQARKLTE